MHDYSNKHSKNAVHRSTDLQTKLSINNTNRRIEVMTIVNKHKSVTIGVHTSLQRGMLNTEQRTKAQIERRAQSRTASGKLRTSNKTGNKTRGHSKPQTAQDKEGPPSSAKRSGPGTRGDTKQKRENPNKQLIL
jgi:hypothetical protein